MPIIAYADNQYFNLNHLKLSDTSYKRAGAVINSIGTFESSGGDGIQVIFGNRIGNTAYFLEAEYSQITENADHATYIGNSIPSLVVTGNTKHNSIFISGKRFFHEGNKIKPYASIGVGYHKITGDFITGMNNSIVVNDSDTAFSYGASIGATISISETVAFNIGYIYRKVNDTTLTSIQSGTPYKGTLTDTNLSVYSMGIHSKF